ncbi:guanylate kinase [Mycoplasma sp. CAG:611]|nr:guanylate kinase [Mycoplasma sp. CAG:611]
MKEDYKMKKKKGLLIVISGPSGIGKTTIRERLVKENDDFWYSISMTTRKPRKIEKTNRYEQNGIDYYFVDEDEFISNIKENNFLEYAEVYKGLYYGTLKDIVFKKLDEGINVILEIDVNGAKQVRKNYKNALLIFIKPRSLEELEYRLRNRRTDTEDAIKERLEKAIYEISNSGIYDYVIESGSKEEDYEKVKNIIEYEKNKKICK